MFSLGLSTFGYGPFERILQARFLSQVVQVLGTLFIWDLFVCLTVTGFTCCLISHRGNTAASVMF